MRILTPHFFASHSEWVIRPVSSLVFPTSKE